MRRFLSWWGVVFGLVSFCYGGSLAQQTGGKLHALPAGAATIEEQFQFRIIAEGLRRLGYQVPAPGEQTYQSGHEAVATGQAHWTANHWYPLHRDFFESHGGTDRLVRAGVLVQDSLQGYLIDRKTAVEYKVHTLTQLKDPKIAALFDHDGNGKADLVGCEVGWACADEIERHLQSLGLSNVVEQKRSGYLGLLMASVMRYNMGRSILYYAWTPMWVSAVLVPGKDAVWLKVPGEGSGGASVLAANSAATGGLGFAVNNQMIVANRAWLEKNPAARTFLALVSLDGQDISRQNMRLRSGESSLEDVDRHVEEWIEEHAEQFNSWVNAATRSAS